MGKGGNNVLELGGEEELAPGHTGGLDTITNLLLVSVGGGSVNVAVTTLEGNLDGRLNLVRLGLPCSQSDSGNFGSCVQDIGLAVREVSQRSREEREYSETDVVFLTAAMICLDINVNGLQVVNLFR